jgi:ketosteroid isomerase-like protein
MSAENVALVRLLLPPPDVDVKALVTDDEASRRSREAIEHHYDPAVLCTMRFPGMGPVTYPGGIDGMREAWKDWLKSWASYRVEIDDVIDGGDCVLVVHRGSGVHSQSSEQVTRRRATIWTIRNGLVARVDFNIPYDEALIEAGISE